MTILKILIPNVLLMLFLINGRSNAETVCFSRDDTIVCYQKFKNQKVERQEKRKIEELIREKAKIIGVDPDLAVKVAYIESRLNQSAVSSKGAIGVMQIMPQTARELGINPYDLEQNIEGGLRYLKMMLERFNSIELALSAYNAGPGNVEKYGGIPPFKETLNYVARIMDKSINPATFTDTKTTRRKNSITPKQIPVKMLMDESGNILITNRL